MGNSRVFEKWVPSMMNTDFESMGKTGMAAMKKDLSIALESAKEFSPRPSTRLSPPQTPSAVAECGCALCTGYPMPMTALALQQYCGSTALSDTRQDAPSVVQLCVPQACCPRGTFSFSSATAASAASSCSSSG